MSTEAIRAAVKEAAEVEYKDGQLVIKTAEGTKTYAPSERWKAVLEMMNE